MVVQSALLLQSVLGLSTLVKLKNVFCAIVRSLKPFQTIFKWNTGIYVPQKELMQVHCSTLRKIEKFTLLAKNT